MADQARFFDIYAAQVSKEIELPAFNFGLYAGLRMERILSEAYPVMKPGDLVVLPLEQPFHSCGREQWTDWQLDNALAWDRIYFSSPLLHRIKITLDSSSLITSLDILKAWLRAKLDPNRVKDRRDVLAPDKEIIQLYQSNKLQTSEFSYSAYNLNSYGTLQNNVGALFRY